MDSNNSRRKDASYVSQAMTASLYGDAPKKKVSSTTFTDFTEAAFLIGYAHAMLATREYLRLSAANGEPLDVALGDVELDLKENWNVLATSRVGHLAYQRLDLEDIINSKGPLEVLRKGVLN